MMLQSPQQATVAQQQKQKRSHKRGTGGMASPQAAPAMGPPGVMAVPPVAMTSTAAAGAAPASGGKRKRSDSHAGAPGLMGMDGQQLGAGPMLMPMQGMPGPTDLMMSGMQQTGGQLLGTPGYSNAGSGGNQSSQQKQMTLTPQQQQQMQVQQQQQQMQYQQMQMPGYAMQSMQGFMQGE